MRRRPALATLASALAFAPLLAGCGGGMGDAPVAVTVIGPSPALDDPDEGPVALPSAVLLSAVGRGLVAYDAEGGVAPGLADRWMVTDDGLSYIFRLGDAAWPDGETVTSRQVVRRLDRARARRSDNRLRPMLEAIGQIVTVTPQVIEIRLTTARPPLLELLAQPAFTLTTPAGGPGPFRIAGEADADPIRLVPVPPPGPVDPEAEPPGPERTVLLSGARAAVAVARFTGGEAALVLGGTIGDLPVARAAGVADAALRFDPANGIMALALRSTDGIVGSPQVRAALAMAIDRPRIVGAFAVQGWQAAEAVLPESYRSALPPAAPAWSALSAPERLQAAAGAIDEAVDGGPPPTVRIAMADTAGTRLLFAFIAHDWSRIGVRAERVAPDAEAEFALVDEVAPAGSAVWFLGEMGCGVPAACAPEVTEALAGVRGSTSLGERGAWLARADRALADAGTLIPIARPLRWSLVAPRLRGFSVNAHAVHPLDQLLAN